MPDHKNQKKSFIFKGLVATLDSYTMSIR